MKLFRLLTALFVLLMQCEAIADVVQPGDDFWYLDEANVLSEETEGVIFFANQRLYDACGAEIVVVTIDSTERMAIDDYAYTLFNDWEIGGNTYRGMLLLAAIEDENYYVMPGTNMGSIFDSAELNQMLDTYLEPDFAARNYDKGIRLFFDEMYERVVDELNLNLSIADAKADYDAFIRNEVINQRNSTVNVNPPAAVQHESGGIGIIPILIIMFLALRMIKRSFGAGSYRRNRSGVSSAAAGFILGRMTSGRRGYYAPKSMRRGLHMGHGFPMGSHHPGKRPSGSSFGGSFSSGNSGGFGGAGRRSGSGFGGASRSGGASRGPSTRGGGSGRFSR